MLDRVKQETLTECAIANVYIEAALELGLEIEFLSKRIGAAVISRDGRELLIHGRWVGINDLTSTMICSDKWYSASFLRRNGLPTPPSVVAYSSCQSSRESAARLLVETARGRYPVCIKPISGSHGANVIPDIRSEEELLWVLFTEPTISSLDIVVESHYAGRHYRVIVAYGDLIGCVERRPPMVTGDGHQTLNELVENYNRGRVAWGLEESVLGRRQTDTIKRRCDTDRDSVVPRGTVVTIDERCNLKVGGTIHFVDTDKIADRARSLCVQAAGLFELDFAGLDLIGDDIQDSASQDWVINEVNSQPAAHVPVPTMTTQQRRIWPKRLLQLHFSI